MQLHSSLRKATELGLAITSIATLILAGCGGGSSSGSSSGSAATTSATITPFKGQFYSGASVALKDANGNIISLLSGGTVNASGVANVTFYSSVTYPLIVEVTGEYYNENTQQPETATVPLRGLIQDASAATSSSGVPVTIVTETAVADLQNRLGSFAAAHPIPAVSAVAALSAAGTLLGVPASAVPAFDPTTHQISDPHTLRLAAWAVMANAQSGVSLAEKVKTLALDLVIGAASAPVITQAEYELAASGVWAAGATPTAPNIPAYNYNALYASAVVVASGGTQMGGARQGIILNPVGVVSTFVGPDNAACVANGGYCPSGAANGIGNTARFYGAYGITTDGMSLFSTDNSSNTIRQTVIATKQVSTLAGTLSPIGGFDDGLGLAARFSLPTGITSDGTNLFITDSGNNNIRKIVIATGQVTTIAGPDNAICVASPAGTCPKGTADGIGAAARFANPAGITTDGINLYVSDTGNCTIRKIVIASREVTTLAGNSALALGFGGFADGVGTSAGFFGPRGITTDGINLYVIDTGNHTIRQIVIASRQVTTIAGTPGIFGITDGVGSAALFHNPAYITTDGSNLYITDDGSHTIRRLSLSTNQVTTLAGVVNGPGYADGTGPTAQFSGIMSNGITTDGRSLYIADAGNNKIRKLQ